jgi:hypothetical protein
MGFANRKKFNQKKKKFNQENILVLPRDKSLAKKKYNFCQERKV